METKKEIKAKSPYWLVDERGHWLLARPCPTGLVNEASPVHSQQTKLSPSLSLSLTVKGKVLRYGSWSFPSEVGPSFLKLSHLSTFRVNHTFGFCSTSSFG